MKNLILIADDEKKIREVLRIYLERAGYIVVEAENGEEALEVFKRKSPSLAVIDVMMPCIDGWSVCRQIRSLSDVPIILLTARSEEYDKLFGFELGIDDYITKPFSPRELVARVNALQRRSNNDSKDKNKKNDLWQGIIQVNNESKRVFVDGKEVLLTPKEYELLCFFMSNPQRAFSREQLLNMVWGYDYYGDLRTVDTHVKQVRAKLGKQLNYIQTVWGVGYSFRVVEDEK